MRLKVFAFVLLLFAALGIFLYLFLATGKVEVPNGKNMSAPEEKSVTLIAVGDVMLSRDVERKILQTRNSTYPFLKVKDFLAKADLVIGNLESPITAGRQISVNEIIFRAPPGSGLGLKNAGFSILTLANNHTMNFGETGLSSTLKELGDIGLFFVGAGHNAAQAYAPVIVEKNGLRIAFLAASDGDVVPASYFASENRAGTASISSVNILNSISEAGKSADFVIVSMHSGTEYARAPNKRQISFAHSAIDAGADLVLGHHPHVIQTIEKYRGKYILYSLGNFVFDQLFSTETCEGLITKSYFNERGLERLELVPIFINSSLQPEIVEGVKVLETLSRYGLSLRYE